MYDNAPVHRAHVVDEYWETNDINHTEWPAQSPDIHTKNDLLAAVRHSWENIEPAYVQGLYSTIPARLKEVIRMKGNLTKYRGKVFIFY